MRSPKGNELVEKIVRAGIRNAPDINSALRWIYFDTKTMSHFRKTACLVYGTRPVWNMIPRKPRWRFRVGV